MAELRRVATVNGIRFTDKTNRQRLSTLIRRYAHALLSMSPRLVYPLEIDGIHRSEKGNHRFRGFEETGTWRR
jgi:hypothetical protein